jgi:protein DJ-1
MQHSIIINQTAGSLAAKTSGLQKQKLTSHPSVKSELEKGESLTQDRSILGHITDPIYLDFEYSEDPVVVSGKLVTRCVIHRSAQ